MRADVASVAVIVLVPAVLKVRLDKVRVPATRVTLPAVAPLSSAIVALGSVLVMVTLGVDVGTTFQFASTALIMTPLVRTVPAIWSDGLPVFPVVVPGTADSPGSRTCSLVAAPALTVIGGLLLAVFVGSVTSVAVTTQLPAVLLVKANDLVPETNAAFTGTTSFASVELMFTTSVTLVIRFQFASTALTVRL